ncbi:MAG: acetate--CoA ligase family protein [Elusimicrobia bacterium]|nr:acetate--CoA ligase family protein [Elusimicrobiota bacterium]
MFEDIELLLEGAGKEGRKSLTEAEAYDVFEKLGLDAPKRALISLDRIPLKDTELDRLLSGFPGDKVVLKVSSHKVLHKTESGGVRVCVKREACVALATFKRAFPDAEAVLVCEFVEHAVFSMGQELLLGARSDAGFGPLMALGLGGTDTEQMTASLKPGLTPAIMPIALLGEAGSWQDFLDRAWVWRYVSGRVRGGERMAEDKAMLKWLEGFAKLLGHFDGEKSRWMIDEVEANPLAVSGGRLVALDGVLRFRQAAPERRDPPSAKAVLALLKPSTVAVAGVSEKKMNMGRIILRNVVEAGFPAKRLFVLKDLEGEIEGARCVRDCASFPEPVDMFVVAVPSGEVPGVLREAAASGKVRGVVLISGGMGEKSGSEGVQDEVLAVIREGRELNADFALSGGNSLGIVSAPAKVNTFFIPKAKLAMPSKENPAIARTAFISQSGAFVVSVISRMGWLKPAYCVSVGNQMDVTVCDYVEAAAQEDSIKVILAYLEGLKPGDGLRLERSIRAARKAGKTVVVYKAGRTPVGQKAVMSHTASIAGDFAAARAVLSRAGALVAETFDEFNDLAQLACFCAGRPKGPRVFALSNAGFETAGMADNILPSGLLQTAAPDAALRGNIERILRDFKLDGIVDVRNPLDLTPMASDEAILKVCEAVLSSACVDAAIVSAVPLTPAMKTLPEEGLKRSLPVRLGPLAKAAAKPVLFCAASGPLYDEYASLAHERGLAVFRAADRAMRAYAKYQEQT